MEEFIGTIKAFAFDFTPQGWLKCEGQLLAIQEYTALFSLIGTKYGGDGRTNFALPDLREMKLNYCILVSMGHGVYPSRS